MCDMYEGSHNDRSMCVLLMFWEHKSLKKVSHTVVTASLWGQNTSKNLT